MSKRAKFTLITWIGENVSGLQRAKISTDKTLVKDIVQVIRVSALRCHFILYAPCYNNIYFMCDCASIDGILVYLMVFNACDALVAVCFSKKMHTSALIQPDCLHISSCFIELKGMGCPLTIVNP